MSRTRKSRTTLGSFTPVRTYRVLVRGKFDRPGPAVREKLLANATADDLVGRLFSEQGSLTYRHHLGGFSFRVVIDVAAGTDAVRRAHGRGRGGTRTASWPSARPAWTTSGSGGAEVSCSSPFPLDSG
jgi:hypothetical protein